MIVKDGWITTNIRRRLVDPTLDFKVTVRPTQACVETFTEATERAAREIGDRYQSIHLSLSGGADSLCVLDCFVRSGVTVKPVIWRIAGNPINRHETEYALRRCSKFGIAPEVIFIEEVEHLRRYYREIFQPIRGGGWFGLQSVMTAQLARDRGGIVVTGDGVILANERRCVKLGLNEWDVYSDALVAEDILVPFFLYSPEIVRSILDALPDDYGNAPVCLVKSAIYGSEYRPKTPGSYAAPEVREAARLISASLPTPNVYGSLETREALLALLS